MTFNEKQPVILTRKNNSWVPGEVTGESDGND